ncbi:diguanylate cyclase [Kibdelosporangium lantanae]|uniref:Diguanylate cyclase n=1 Tax=Kibdelosporangium lantanae TaxID=1497396 RepID=A0ABW3M366_9PSEU
MTATVGHVSERLLTPGEVAALFRVDPKTVTRWATAGRIGLVSKSGTLTYQLMYELRDIGFSTAVGIGGDPVIGTTHIDCLQAFQDDPETDLVVMIGEIGGDAEERAAAFIKENVVILTCWLSVASLTEHPLKTALGTAQDNALEAATLCLGVFIAIALDRYPLLVVVGVPLILVLHRNVLIRQLEEDARTDTKTGLLNATAWTDTARDEISRAQRRGESVGILVLDLDLFKRINDTYGHLAGDDVLLEFAAATRTEVRVSDSVGRFGGEEFVVLLPDITVDHMVAIAERIRKRIENLTVIASSGSAPQIITDLSVSIGASAYPVHGMDLDQLMDAADKALYKAKDNGRNQTQVAPPLEPDGL